MVHELRKDSTSTTRGVRRRRGRCLSLLFSALVAASLTVVSPATAQASTFTCATSTNYANVLYCNGDVIGLNAGAYPVGRKIALKSVSVSSGASGLVRTVSTVGPVSFCAAGTYCGATMGTSLVSTTVTFKAASLAPPVGRYVDVYGTVSARTALSPTGWVFNDANNPAFW